MAIWLFRAGQSGEYENLFFKENRLFLTWSGLDTDLSKFQDRKALYTWLTEHYPDEKVGALRNWTGQVYPVAQEMRIGDWVIVPSKLKAVIHVAEITGNYEYFPDAEDRFQHSIKVKWIQKDIPRTHFEQDLLYSFGAFMTVCRIQRNNAEERLRAMARNGWKPALTIGGEKNFLEKTGESEFSDLEGVANDQLGKWLIRRFKGHGMERLIEAILKAKGYFTYRRSPEKKSGDKGVDILAAPEPFGFGTPRLVVQVKTRDPPVDRPTLAQLIGTIQNFHAEHGLLVSWSGFKSSLDEEIANKFFKVRFWGQREIVQELLNNYDKLDEEIKAEIPLKRIWTLSIGED
ncbi:MAG: restriction endonuclease [Planctomycetota bacterium]